MSIVMADFVLKRQGFLLEMECEINDRVTAIFGASGAGKTSFLNVLAGLESPEDGKVVINDREVFNVAKKINLPPEKRKIGYVFQEGRLFPHMNVEQNLKYGYNKKPDTGFFSDVVELLKIADIIGKKATEISGGQAQRVAIGRALLTSPDLLILDEPFSSLDKGLRQHIIALLKPMIDTFNIPMLVVSHDLSDLLLLSDQLLIIKDGKNVGHGNYYDLISKSDAVNVLNKSGLMNSIELKLDYIDSDKGLIILSYQDMQIVAESILEKHRYYDDRYLSVSLRPEDITLALHKIEDISIQNQIEGTIEQLIIADNKVLCVIDHGFKLIAEVTIATMQKMELKKGTKIWSLFKAAAVKMNIPGIVNSSEL